MFHCIISYLFFCIFIYSRMKVFLLPFLLIVVEWCRTKVYNLLHCNSECMSILSQKYHGTIFQKSVSKSNLNTMSVLDGCNCCWEIFEEYYSRSGCLWVITICEKPFLVFSSIFIMSEFIQQWSCVNLCAAEGVRWAELLRILQNAFSYNVRRKTQAHKWYRKF